jgi:hypothetical protein
MIRICSSNEQPGSLELAFITVKIMLLRGVFPKLHRRNIQSASHVDQAVEMTSKVISLVETLQINRLSAFWWSCEYFDFLFHDWVYLKY